MGVILLVLGIAIVGYGIFGSSQPSYNKPELFRSAGGTIAVFAVGIGLIIFGVKAL